MCDGGRISRRGRVVHGAIAGAISHTHDGTGRAHLHGDAIRRKDTQIWRYEVELVAGLNHGAVAGPCGVLDAGRGWGQHNRRAIPGVIPHHNLHIGRQHSPHLVACLVECAARGIGGDHLLWNVANTSGSGKARLRGGDIRGVSRAEYVAGPYYRVMRALLSRVANHTVRKEQSGYIYNAQEKSK